MKINTILLHNYNKKHLIKKRYNNQFSQNSSNNVMCISNYHMVNFYGHPDNIEGLKYFEPARVENGKIINKNNNILLSSKDDLIALSNTPKFWDNKSIALSSNIDLSDIKNWTPIGNESNPFSSKFNGNGYCISNINVESNSNNQGLFGYIKDSNINNVKITGAYIKGKNQAGILAGIAKNSNINRCSVQGKVEGQHRIGGLVGISYNNHFLQNLTVAKVKGTEDVGGIIGFDFNSKISQIYNNSEILGLTKNIGGLLGYGYKTNIEDIAVSIVNISGLSNVGNLIGNGKNLSLKNIILFQNSQLDILGNEDIAEIRNVYQNEQSLETEYLDKNVWHCQEGHIPHLNWQIKDKSFKQILSEDFPIYMNVLRSIPDDIIESDFIDIMFEDFEKRTPLYYCKNFQQAESLIKKGADIFHKDIYLQTPMHKFCASGDTEIVLLLLNNGAAYFQKDINGKYPIDLAKQNGQSDILREFTIGDKGFSKVIGMNELKETLTNNVL